MKSKTAMQILASWLNTSKTGFEIYHKAVELQALEKHQIQEAHRSGQFSADGKDPSVSESLAYYITTYQ